MVSLTRQSERYAVHCKCFVTGAIPKKEGDELLIPSACQKSPVAMQQWGFKHEKNRKRKKDCHLWMASFLRFIAANLSLTHAVTAVSPR